MKSLVNYQEIEKAYNEYLTMLQRPHYFHLTF